MAIENFMKAVNIGVTPDAASYYAEIAGSSERLAKYRKAAFAYQKALQFKEDATIYYLLASLYDSKLKDKKNAVMYYKKYIASKPSQKKQTYLAYAQSRIDQLGH
jgi:tetratricopeptide (TPR) repeat protein